MRHADDHDGRARRARGAVLALATMIVAGCVEPTPRNAPAPAAPLAPPPPESPVPTTTIDSPEAATNHFAARRDAEAIPMPEGSELAVECCVRTSLIGDPVGMPVVVRLRLPAPYEDGEPAVVGTGEAYAFQESLALADRAPAAATRFDALLRTPSWERLRSQAPTIASRGARALAAAYERLATLERFRTWQARGHEVRTNLVASADGERTNVYLVAFEPDRPGPVDTITVEVAQAGAILAVFVGFERMRVDALDRAAPPTEPPASTR